MHGEAGVGKTALLDYVGDQATGCRVIRASGVESEMELAYAALQQLCAPLLDDLGHLPAPQRNALSTAFGLSAGPAPDRLLIGLAVLSMFSDVAEERPLVCLVDDLQWLDGASAQILAICGPPARRGIGGFGPGNEGSQPRHGHALGTRDQWPQGRRRAGIAGHGAYRAA
jgi:hypothetical protein